jgi:hypothetical protein
MTASPPQAPRAHRSSRMTLSILAFLAIAAAALSIYAGVFKDDVVMARFQAVTGDFAITPTVDGEPVAEPITPAVAPTTIPSSSTGPGASAATPGDGTSDAGSDGDDGELDPAGEDAEPGTANTPAPYTGRLLGVDGFSMSASDNMRPGDTLIGGVNVQNVSGSDFELAISVSGTDPNDCFSYTIAPRQRDATGAWVPIGDALGNGASPSIAATTALGTWRAGDLRRFVITLMMDDTCTVGGGLSSNGSESVADRHPDHAKATLAIAFNATGGDA